MYGNDNGGNITGVRYIDNDGVSNSNAVTRYFWDGLINRDYLGNDYTDKNDRRTVNARIFLCPSDKVNRAYGNNTKEYGTPRSYAVTVLTPTTSTPKHMKDYVRPSQTVVHMEYQPTYSYFNSNLASQSYSEKSKYNAAAGSGLIDRYAPHRQSSNFSFADGHAERVGYGKLSDNAWSLK